MQFFLRVAGILGILITVIWWYQKPDFDPLFNFVTSIAAFVGSFFVPNSKNQSGILDQRNRQILLDHVENFWVKGVLEKSLHGVALLELGIKEEENAVPYPWMVKKDTTNEILPAGKSMLEIYEEVGMGRSLLILGSPGSGKTTMLLELARQLIKRAKKEDLEPVPVVFNLAAWRSTQSLIEWLEEQLNIIYYVPKKDALGWISENRMFLLLDGLDEVREDSLTKCVEAINQFRNEHGFTSMVICSRLEDYKTTSMKLSCEGAVVLQPLTSTQIHTYIDRFGNRLASVRLLLRKDKALEELIETPLMLSVMVLAYKDRNTNDMIDHGSMEGNRKHLFQIYIDRMFERSARNVNPSFSKEQTLNYLRWLALMMTKHNIANYHIEMMQPSWLMKKTDKYLYIGISGLMGGLIVALLVGSVGALFGNFNGALVVGLLIGLFSVFAFGILSGLNNSIKMVDVFQWSWQRVLFMFIAWIIIGPVSWLIWKDPSVLLGSLLLTAILGGMLEVETEETTRPGDRLQKTLYNTILFVMVLVVLSLVNSFVFNKPLRDALATVLLISPTVALFIIGTGVIEHYALRMVLAWQGIYPLHLIPFLEYAVDLIFLRRVGGSYIFVHRLLMEHFAEMEIHPNKTKK